MKISDLLCNRDFDVNAEYRIYHGVWDDSGELLWDSFKDGKICEDDDISSYHITYITVDIETKQIIIEIL